MAGEDNYDKIIAYIILVVLLPFSRVASYSALFRSPFPRLRGTWYGAARRLTLILIYVHLSNMTL
jgi:hypothetical protein